MLISFVITSILFVPFINFLYKIKLKDPNPSNHKDIFGKSTPIFQKLRSKTANTPIGGGLLVVLVVSILTLIIFRKSLNDQVIAILVTFISFMFLGLFDDLKKTFHFKKGPFELGVKQKFVLQLIIAIAISYWCVSKGLIHISVPGLFKIESTFWLVALSSVGMTFMLNAYNITDGVDGLSAGTLIIALIGIIALSGYQGNTVVGLFSSLLIGAMISYLYFNTHPARLLMGDSGSLAFGSVFFLVLLMLDYAYIIPILGFLYIAEALSSLIQWYSRKFFNKKVFDSAPLHYHFENKGWSQTKVSMRAYILQAVLLFITLSLVSVL
jgi:phospho-N-acetylmuramoyl-pentapeptide-transferase